MRRGVLEEQGGSGVGGRRVGGVNVNGDGDRGGVDEAMRHRGAAED